MEGLMQIYPAQVRGPAGEAGTCERRLGFASATSRYYGLFKKKKVKEGGMHDDTWRSCL